MGGSRAILKKVVPGPHTLKDWDTYRHAHSYAEGLSFKKAIKATVDIGDSLGLDVQTNEVKHAYNLCFCRKISCI